MLFDGERSNTWAGWVLALIGVVFGLMLASPVAIWLWEKVGNMLGI